MKIFTFHKRKGQSKARGNFTNTATCRNKIPAIFLWIFAIVRGILKFVSFCSTMSRGTSLDALRNPGWEKLVSAFDTSRMPSAFFPAFCWPPT